MSYEVSAYGWISLSPRSAQWRHDVSMLASSMLATAKREISPVLHTASSTIRRDARLN
jgi:hypothetical protein